MKKIFVLATAIFLCALAFQPRSSLKLAQQSSRATCLNTINVPGDLSSIQAAIDAAAPGDVILVSDGTYFENLRVNKTIQLIGEDPETTIVDGSTADPTTFSPVVYVFGENANNVRISNFTLRGSSTSWGIYLALSTSAWIEKNIVCNNSGGIEALSSDNNTFINNTIINNKYEGLEFFSSDGHTMRTNILSGNRYNFGMYGSSCNDDIDMSNLVNGKPIFYLKNQTGLLITSAVLPNPGYVALINCTNVTVENLTLENNINGLVLAGTGNSVVRNNTLRNNMRGLDITDSTTNTIEGNSVTNSTWQAMSIAHSPNNVLRSNNLTDNYFGLKVTGDSLSDFTQDLDTSNTVEGKTMYYLINQTSFAINPSTFDNVGYLALVNCRNITADSLSLDHDNLLAAFTQNCSITENTITKGTVAFINCSALSLEDNTIADGDSGISLQNSNNNTLSRNVITGNTEAGILLQTSRNNILADNDIRNDSTGIELADSENNTIFRNNIADNKYYGVLIREASHNLFYHNNFTNPQPFPYQVVNSSPFSENDFDNGYPSGGNYWSAYNGTDKFSGTHQNETGNDGVGDTKYTTFFWVNDRYPLIQPIQTFNWYTWQGKTLYTELVSNSTLSSFNLDQAQKTMSFNATGSDGTTGFCRITLANIIVQNLWTDGYKITINGETVPYRNWTDTENNYVYVNYTHSTRQIVILPESPAVATIIFAAALTVLLIKLKKRHPATEAKTSKCSACARVCMYG